MSKAFPAAAPLIFRCVRSYGETFSALWPDVTSDCREEEHADCNVERQEVGGEEGHQVHPVVKRESTLPKTDVTDTSFMTSPCTVDHRFLKTLHLHSPAPALPYNSLIPDLLSKWEM